MSTSGKANILVVDDLPDKLFVLQSILEELDQNVILARSGEEALRRVLENDFAVILLDVNMPGGIDGFETAALIRRRRKSAHVPIIFITAYADEMLTAQGYSLGAVDYILSPVVPEVLRTKVRAFVDLHLMTEQVRRQADERVALAREQAARAAAEEATRRSAFLAEASRVLASSLDPETTLRGLARVVIPSLADLSAVVGVDDRGQPGRTELAWADPDGAVHTASSPEASLPAALADGIRHVLELRRAETLSGLDAAFPIAPPSGINDARKLARALLLPLLARNRLLGVLALVRGEGPPAGAGDLALAEDLAGRAAIALDNARLHQNIQEVDRRKDEFLAMLAHELRNPLAPIRTAVEVMRKVGPSNPILDQSRDMIDRQVTHMTRLIEELLDVSRLSRGKILLRQELVDLPALVQRTAGDYRAVFEKSGLSLELSLVEGPLLVLGDATRLAQVVGNLLHNAVKFTERGGKVQMHLARTEHDRAVLSIRDTGIGIEPALLPCVFEAFTQADRSLDRSRGGLGLGLTLVKRLVELHGGEVSIHSAGLGTGTEVWIDLPTHVEIPAEAARATVAEGAAGARPEPEAAEPALRLLVIEDNPDVAESLRVLLCLAGHEVVLAATGDSGLEKARQYHPAVVLCDIGLPGRMDGYAVARALRADGNLAGVYLVAVTGYGRPEDQRLAREAGFDAHLTKPIDLGQLRHLLAERPRL
jgi:signal transduction histidine kinase/DNA-binding response OmpR family regulator